MIKYTKTGKKNLVSPCFIKEACNVNKEKNLFNLFFTENILHIICLYINAKIDI